MRAWVVLKGETIQRSANIFVKLWPHLWVETLFTVQYQFLGPVQVFLGYQKTEVNCRFCVVSRKVLQVFAPKTLIFRFVSERQHLLSEFNLEIDFL